MRRKGLHILVEMYGVEQKFLDDILFIKNSFFKATKVSNLVPVQNSFSFHKFKPQGVTAILLLTTSHISIHTWPEFGYAALDVFACDEHEKTRRAVEFLIKTFKPKRVRKVELRRGYIVKKN